MPQTITANDLRVLGKYAQPGTGVWRKIPQEDKDVYAKLHQRLKEIAVHAVSSGNLANIYEYRLNRFNPSGGVQGNRPISLWCALYPRGVPERMPQVYLILSRNGMELGYAAAIHPNDFYDEPSKTRTRQVAPRIFSALPNADSREVHELSVRLKDRGWWKYRRKARLTPGENDFESLEDLIKFLKSDEGGRWCAGNVVRYWLLNELPEDTELNEEFADAAELFRPLMVQPDPPITSPPPVAAPPQVGSIKDDLERFMRTYVEMRSKSFGVDEELRQLMDNLERRLSALPALRSRPTIKVKWSVGQGNWARVPWIALLDSRVTQTTQQGTYVVFLFRDDMTGVYLTFNQGVTEPMAARGATAGLQLLRENASAIRNDCPRLREQHFQLDDEIDLRSEGKLGRDYEAATIAYKLYERGRVPTDDAIAEDLEAVLAAYARHIKKDAEDSEERSPRPIREGPPFTMDDALSDLFLERHELQQLLDVWRVKKNLIVQGPPGVGKTFLARRLAYLLMGHRDQARVKMVQFHQAYSYENFIQGFRPSEEGGFVRREGPFYNFAKLAEVEPDRAYVFIIDEINRGNLAKILGELMMLIEADKRGPEFAMPLMYQEAKDAPFSVPPNLFLLGLMNTADRSLAMVDYALRRRFAFHNLQPRFTSTLFKEFIRARAENDEIVTTVIDRLSALNEAIASDTVRLGPGYQIGHSYFVPNDGSGPLDAKLYVRIIATEIAPLLREYWFDNKKEAESWIERLLEGYA